jgi:hypothetical protein
MVILLPPPQILSSQIPIKNSVSSGEREKREVAKY